VLYGKMRPYLNKVWVAEFDGICSAEFLVFPKHEALNSHFLALRLNGEDFVAFANGQVSGERPRVNFAALSRFPILLPPIAEQERIVAKANLILTKVRSAEISARSAQNRLRDYRTAVLHDAITGELTREWRKSHKRDDTGQKLLQHLLQTRRAKWEQAELRRLNKAAKTTKENRWKSRYPEPIDPESAELPNLPRNWAWASAAQLTDASRPITYGVVKLGAEVKGGVPILRSSDVRHLNLELDHVKRIAKAIADEYLRTYLKGGEVLVTVRGTLGGVAQVPEECAGYNISREVAMLALLEPKTSLAIAYFIGSDILQQWLRSRTKGIAYTGVNIETLRALPIPVMPLSEQALIVSQVRRRLSAADRTATTLSRQLEKARLTRQSLIRDAFAGHLVPQDPNDTPASIHLDHIHSTLVAKAREPTGKHMAKPKTDRSLRPLLDVLRAHKRPMSPEQLFRDSGYQQRFEENDCRQDIVDKFYEELRAITGSRGPVTEIRPDRNTVLLEVK
jgi:type I restriction enzyme S subunit